MKLTILARTNTWHIKDLLRAAKKKKIETNVIDIKNLWNLDEVKDQVSDIVLVRSLTLSAVRSRRAVFFKLIKEGRNIINPVHAIQPFIHSKVYQQWMAKEHIKCPTIPTYDFNSLDEVKTALKKGVLELPMIQKPDIGIKGIGVELIKDIGDIKEDGLKKTLFQPFIENSGDYRIWVLDGEVLGVTQRIGKKGSHVNNVAQGGKMLKVDDQNIIEGLSNLSLDIAKYFDLNMCGIDIMFDKKDQKFKFLEVNSVPGWKGFQHATKIDVAGKIIDFVIKKGKEGAVKNKS